MAGRDRMAIFPSRANHVFMKQRIVSAVKGLSLLKRKRDALELKLREINAELKKSVTIVEEIMHEAIFSMAKANYLSTDFKPATVLTPKKADIYMTIKNVKIVGLVVPTFKLIMKAAQSLPLTGLSRGGTQVEIIRKKFQEAIQVLISVASLEYAVKVLQEGVRQNNMRVNGLDYVVIPRFQNTLAYIADELDEYEREDFYRLKRSQAKQRKAKEQFSLLIKQKNRERELEAQSNIVRTNIEIPGTLLETFNIDEFEDTVRAAQNETVDQEENVETVVNDINPEQDETTRPETDAENEEEQS